MALGARRRSQGETVLMRYPDRVTVCVSTQAGWPWPAISAPPGRPGPAPTDPGEIVEQIAGAMREAGAATGLQHRFHGTGEPWPTRPGLGAVAAARRHGPLARHLTLSTVGIVPGIRRLATETLPVNLAVSLHAANDVLRDELVPINRRYPLAVLAEACAA